MPVGLHLCFHLAMDVVRTGFLVVLFAVVRRKLMRKIAGRGIIIMSVCACYKSTPLLTAICRVGVMPMVFVAVALMCVIVHKDHPL